MYLLELMNTLLQCKLLKIKNILMAIPWAQEAWKEVTGMTIKNCFEKCRIIKNDDLMEIGEKDLEFEVLVQESCPNISATKYINFKPLSFTESLKMLDKINKCSSLDEESYKMLSTATKKLENLQLQNK